MRDLLRAVAKTGTASAATLLLGVIATKVIAVAAGPSGVGLFSIFRQAVQTAVILALLNGQMAIVQGIASREGQERRQFISAVFWFLLFWTAVLCMIIAAAAGPIAHWLTRETHAADAASVRILIIPIACGALWMFSISLLNGYRIVGRAALIQVCNFFLIAVLAYPAVRYERTGHRESFALLLAAAAIGAAILGLFLVSRSGVLSWSRASFAAERRSLILQFLTMSGALVVSGLVSFAVPLQIRTTTVAVFGLTGAGIFDVAWTLSMAYVLIILTSFSSYYLPALSGISDSAARLQLMRNVFRLSSMMVVPLVTIVVVLKPLVVTLLYSREFLPAIHMMRWMLIGDYFKVLSWVFSFTMVAYADIRTFLWTEVLWGLMSLGGATIALRRFHTLEGVGMTFAALYILYFIYTAYYVRRRHGFAVSQAITVGSIAGFATIVGASLQTWSESAVDWRGGILWVSMAVLSSCLLFTSSERSFLYSLLRHRAQPV